MPSLRKIQWVSQTFSITSAYTSVNINQEACHTITISSLDSCSTHAITISSAHAAKTMAITSKKQPLTMRNRQLNNHRWWQTITIPRQCPSAITIEKHIHDQHNIKIWNLQLEDIEDPCCNGLITVAVEICAPSRVNHGGTPHSPMRRASMVLNNKGNCNSPSSQFHHYDTKVEIPARS